MYELSHGTGLVWWEASTVDSYHPTSKDALPSDFRCDAVLKPLDDKFVFEKCCCCIPLRTGCLILGYLQLVSLIVAGIYALLGIASGTAIINSEELNQFQDKEIREELQFVGKVLIILCVLSLVLVVVTLPFTILLLCGIHKERRNYVRYYLIFATVVLVLNVILKIAQFAGGYAKGNEAPAAVISILLSVYFLLVLRSQYIKMGHEAANAQQYRDGHLMNTQKI